jgi:hypothetical protein
MLLGMDPPEKYICIWFWFDLMCWGQLYLIVGPSLAGEELHLSPLLCIFIKNSTNNIPKTKQSSIYGIFAFFLNYSVEKTSYSDQILRVRVDLKGEKREIFWSRFFSWIYSIWAPDFEAKRIFFPLSFSRNHSNISMNPCCQLLRGFKISAVAYCTYCIVIPYVAYSAYVRYNFPV